MLRHESRYISKREICELIPMAQQQRKIKTALKKELYDGAGGKCANPGCANWRTHIHHIKHWAIYKCHNTGDMIAVCPSCHDEVHHGNLKISDETLYRWKRIDRGLVPAAAHIYVERAPELRLLTGTIALSPTNDSLIVFELSNTNRLKLRVLDSEILQVTLQLRNCKGMEVLRVVENHLHVVRDPEIEFEFRAGHARVTVPASETYIPSWVIQSMRFQDKTFADYGRVIALDIEVMRPGLVKVQGFWPAEEGCIVITQDAISFCRQGNPHPVSLRGDGEASVLIFTGLVNSKMFGFG